MALKSMQASLGKLYCLSVLCAPALYCRLVLIWQGCNISLKEVFLQEIISFKEVIIL